MRIGLLYSSLRGFNTLDGGIASHFAELAAGLAEAGAAVRVYVVSERAPDSQPVSPEGYEIESLSITLPRWLHRLTGRPWQVHFLTSLWFRARAAAQFVIADHTKRPLDLIETSSSGLLAMHLARARCRPRLVTRVSTTADQLVAHNKGAMGWLPRVENSLERALVLRSDSILTHSRHHRDAFCAAWRLDPARVTLIPHGIGLPPAAELPVAAASPTSPRILFVGRFETRKGIDTLLTALPTVLAAQPSATAVLAGHDEGSYWQNKFWAENPTLDRNRVSFPGRIDVQTLQQLYRNSDVFVAPSRYESFGLIYVEAMGWAKPVIGCNAGGVPEVIVDGETGFLITPGDAAALSRQLNALLADPALRVRFGRAGRARVERLFTRSAMAQASLAHYAKIVAGDVRAN